MKQQLIEMPRNFLEDFHIKDCVRTSTLFPLENSFTKYSSSSQNKFKRRIRQLDKAGASEVSNLFQLQRIQRDYDLFVETSLYLQKLLGNTVLISEALKVERLQHCYVLFTRTHLVDGDELDPVLEHFRHMGVPCNKQNMM